jgi:hypothetical protein
MLACTIPALGQAGVLHIEEADELAVSDRATLHVRLSLPDDAAEPVLLTLHGRGAALEVVRGRMTRADAIAHGERELEFAVPVVAREPGTAIFAAEVLFYRCSDDCVAVREEATRVVQVLAR